MAELRAAQVQIATDRVQPGPIQCAMSREWTSAVELACVDDDGAVAGYLDTGTHVATGYYR